jgi:hypothetical protein
MEIRFADLADESRVSDWFDPSDYSDVDEFREAVSEFAEEFVVEDSTDSPVNIPRFTLLSDILELAEGLDDYWDISALRAYSDNESWTIRDCIDGMEEAMERYEGVYSTEEQFAQQWAENIGDYNPSRVSWPMNHIDWIAAWESIEDDFEVIDDYYFRRY